MTLLTYDEYAVAKSQVKLIEEFIRKDILPYIDGCHEIQFGTERTRSGKSQLNLYVDHSLGITGYSGYLLISFDEDYVPRECGSGVSVYDSWNYGGNFCYELIKDWQSIKNKLLNLRVKQEREARERKSVFQNFAI